MTLRRILLLAMVIAGTVLVSDVAFRSTLLRTLWPLVTSPADGGIVTPPLAVRWEGPPRLSVALITGAMRQDLGEHDSPFDIAPERFPHPGQYALELRSPLLGAWSQTERRFLVQLPEPSPAPTPCKDQGGEIEMLHESVRRLESERNEATEEAADLRQTAEQLRAENSELIASIDELHEVEEQVDAMHDLIDAQREDLVRQQQELQEENRLLRTRIESLPPCTAWGYLTYPRPQTLPTTRRFVVASDSRGLIFQNQIQCEMTRRVDRGAASPCICIGQTWGR